MPPPSMPSETEIIGRAAPTLTRIRRPPSEKEGTFSSGTFAVEEPSNEHLPEKSSSGDES